MRVYEEHIGALFLTSIISFKYIFLNGDCVIKKIFLIFIISSLSIVSFYIAKQSISFKEVTSIYNKIIFVDPGHGGKDDGASREQVAEDEINLKIASKLFELLLKENFVAYITRSGDYDLASLYASNRKREDLKNRATAITTSNADAFVSIHLNALNDASVHGPMVYYRAKDESSKKLAEITQQKLNEMANVDKKTHTEDYYLFRATTCVGILVECGFISNSNERKNLLDNNYQNLIAKTILDSLIAYYKISI